MATVRFNLRRHKHANPSIELIYRLEADRKKLRIGTKLRIPEKHWNPNTMRAKLVKGFMDAETINHILDLWESSVKSVVRKYSLEDGEPPSLDQFRKAVNAEVNGQPLSSNNKEMLPFFKSYINSRKAQVTASTIKQYDNAYNHLEKYIQKKHGGKKIEFADIDISFLQGFTRYLRSFKKPLVDNTINKIQKRITAVLNKATLKGINNNLDFKDTAEWKISYIRQPKIYLNEEEILQIKNLKLETKGRLDKIRDTLLIGLACGLRYSDLSKLGKEEIVYREGRSYINKLTVKGKNYVLIPLKKEILDIVEKYDGFPPTISLQKFNTYLTELCKKADISSTVFKTENKEQVAYKKYQLVSSHICRRSFATNGYKAGVDINLLKDITGHTTIKQFLDYVQIDEDESAELLSNHSFFQ